MATSLGWLYLAASALSVLTILVPRYPGISSAQVAAVAAVAAALAGVLLLVGRRLPLAAFPALVGAGTVLTGVGIHVTQGVPNAASMFFLWIALYSFYFFSQRVAFAQMGLVGFTYAAVIALRPPPFPAVAHWVTTVGTLTIAGVLVGVLSRRLTRRTAELEQRERETRLVLDTAHDAFVSMDEDGRVVEWNPQAAATFGWEREEAVGRPLAELIIPPAARRMHAAALARFVATGEGATVNSRTEVDALHRDGSSLPVEIAMSSSRRDGRYVFNAFLRDISERRRTEGYVAAQYEVTRLLAHAPTWEVVEEGLLATLGSRLGWSVGALWVWDDGDSALRCARTWRAPGVAAPHFESATREVSLGRGRGLVGSVLETGEPAWIRDVAADPRFVRADDASADGLVSAIAVPIRHAGEVVAAIELLTREPRAPDPALLTMLAGLGTQLGQCWVRRREERRALEDASLIATLAAATQELTRITDPEDTRPAICRAALEVGGASVAVLYEPSGGRLAATAAAGAGAGAPDGAPIERATAARAFEARERLVATSAGAAALLTDRAGIGSVVFEPVGTDGGACAVLVVGWREPRARLPEGLDSALPLLAAESAVAIERGNLLRRLDDAARTDALTGTANRRALDEALARELAAAGRTGAPLSLAILDLDRFKPYNDRHGHQAGDRLLKELAAAWREQMRETDLLSRYGGDEFVVLFPDCPLEQAERLVERLRRITAHGQTFSAGVCAWNGAEAPDELLARADAALYDAKAAGRNRTVPSRAR